jgi:serine/threonine protein kinase/tetratricopeptide (TPR) repeat protein
VIEIPGYRILRQLGRGGMATVYLALQESVQREVAIKVMSPTLLADPDFGERFLREARIAARLHHRHVVGIHDVGRIGDYNYMAMEYLGGGPILARDAGPRPVRFALRIAREIGMALHYAHAKGFVHRDVKPDNILLREDTSSALTDFGIARANDSERMTRTGAVIGTPHYMSPEQARGRPIDGRADLYSLGIVLYELLVGRVPFHADDSLAVGIMHITQPVPILPEALQPLQPVLNRLLAKQPEDRFQNGQQVADAIEQIELQMANGELPDMENPDDAYRREVPGGSPSPAQRMTTPSPAQRMTTPPPVQRGSSTPSPSQRTNTPSPQMRRAEPSIGRMDEFVAVERRRPGARTSESGRSEGGGRSAARIIVPIVLVLLLAGGAAGAWFYQDRLRALLPSTELNGLISRGQKALAENRLIGTQGDSARELFQSARALDADNDQVRKGLDAVGAQLVVQSRAALEHKDLATAHTDLAAAEEVLGGGPEIEQLKADLQAAETHGTATEDLLRRGDAALAAGKLLGDDGASALYQKVLAADATNALALNGLKKAADSQAALVREAIGAGNADLANQRITDLAKLSPNHPSIPELRAALSTLRTAAAKPREAAPPPARETAPPPSPRDNGTLSSEQQLVKAEAQLRAGNMAGDDGALALFHAVLKRDPKNARAKAGLRRVAQGLVTQANAALDENSLADAEKLVQQADAAASDLPDLKALKSRMREEREQHDIAGKHTQVSAENQASIDQLLEQGDKAMAAGNINVPPGDSAYDKYRAVLRLDGNNAKAFAGLGRIPVRARELFEQALKANTPNKARMYLDAIADVDPNNASVPPLRERLANLYLDQAEARAEQGLRGDAERALASARELSPNNPRVTSINEKIQAIPAAPPAGG